MKFNLRTLFVLVAVTAVGLTSWLWWERKGRHLEYNQRWDWIVDRRTLPEYQQWKEYEARVLSGPKKGQQAGLQRAMEWHERVCRHPVSKRWLSPEARALLK